MVGDEPLFAVVGGEQFGAGQEEHSPPLQPSFAIRLPVGLNEERQHLGAIDVIPNAIPAESMDPDAPVCGDCGMTLQELMNR